MVKPNASWVMVTFERPPAYEQNDRADTTVGRPTLTLRPGRMLT